MQRNTYTRVTFGDALLRAIALDYTPSTLFARYVQLYASTPNNYGWTLDEDAFRSVVRFLQRNAYRRLCQLRRRNRRRQGANRSGASEGGEHSSSSSSDSSTDSDDEHLHIAAYVAPEQESDTFMVGVSYDGNNNVYALPALSWATWLTTPIDPVTWERLPLPDILCRSIRTLTLHGPDYEYQMHQFGRIRQLRLLDQATARSTWWCDACRGILLVPHTGHHHCTVCLNYDLCTRCHKRHRDSVVDCGHSDVHDSTHSFDEIESTQQQRQLQIPPEALEEARALRRQQERSAAAGAA